MANDHALAVGPPGRAGIDHARQRLDQVAQLGNLRWQLIEARRVHLKGRNASVHRLVAE
jgi:hypothetical protein